MKNRLPLVSLPHNHFLVHYFLWENYFLFTSTFLVHSQGIQQGWRVIEIGQFSWRAQEKLCPFTICSQGTADARWLEGVRQPELLNWCTRQARYMERSPWDWEIPRTCPYAKPHKCIVQLAAVAQPASVRQTSHGLWKLFMCTAAVHTTAWNNTSLFITPPV